MLWADAELWRSALKTEHAGIDEKIRELFYHTHVVQHVYYQMWTGKELSFPDLPEFGDFMEIAKWGSECASKIVNLVKIMEEIEFEMILPNPWKEKIRKSLGQIPEDATVGQSILQVVSHSNYHRAQINSCIRELEGEPANLDFITWIWLGKPEPQWDSLLKVAGH